MFAMSQSTCTEPREPVEHGGILTCATPKSNHKDVFEGL